MAGGRGAAGRRPRLLGAAEATDGLPAARDEGLPQLALQVRMDWLTASTCPAGLFFRNKLIRTAADMRTRRLCDH